MVIFASKFYFFCPYKFSYVGKTRRSNMLLNGGDRVK